MDWKPIKKSPESLAVPPNMEDYHRARAAFSWEDIEGELQGLPGGQGLNIAHEAVDRHVLAGLGDRTALRWLGRDGTVSDYSYSEMMEQSNRFANLLGELGVRRGERVFVLTGRIPELYFAALGAWKRGCVFCPLFSAFGPEPIFQRMSRGDARVLVTTTGLYRRKVEMLRRRLPDLRHILLTDAGDEPDVGGLSWRRKMAEVSGEFAIPPTDPEDRAILHFTSGTTGMPKGAIHVHAAVNTHYMTGKYVLDLHPDDIYWCTADPGWVTGTSYGIIAPLTHGVTSIVDEADFDAERWCRTLEEQKVSVWYTAPTAIRMLMRMKTAPREGYDLKELRLVHSVGEPLSPEAIFWGQKALGLPIHDNWWQTETGGIMIANYPSVDIRPGSMGLPLPGIEAAIVRRIEGGEVEVLGAGVEGELALRSGWPSMCRGYLPDEKRYRACFAGGWYLSGDLAERDEDGYFWFLGRADDIIKTSWHMVGPFEVESALMEHPAVAEAGVIGRPEPMIGELVKAFVCLKEEFEASEELRLEILAFARTRLGSAVAPKEIEFTADLPKTRSGKIIRRLLKVRELGLPEGDPSTLEVNG